MSKFLNLALGVLFSVTVAGLVAGEISRVVQSTFAETNAAMALAAGK